MTTNTLSLLERCKTALIELPFDSGTLIKDLEAAIAEQTKLPEKEYFCFCDKNASLQMVSGGAAKEGYLGRVTLKIDDKYVDYIRAEQAKPSQVNSQEPVACSKCKQSICDISGCNSATCPTRIEFNAWWLTSKYTQVVNPTLADKQRALDAWFAARQVYTSPQLKPLSDDEIMHEYMVCDGLQINCDFKDLVRFARALEAKLGARHG